MRSSRSRHSSSIRSENRRSDMEILAMGKVLTAVRIENLQDLFDVEKGALPADSRRFVDVADALVDTVATLLSLPKRFIEKLGLKLHRTRTACTVPGTVSFGVYEPVRLTIQDRDCVIEVAEIPDDCPVLIGQIPL